VWIKKDPRDFENRSFWYPIALFCPQAVILFFCVIDVLHIHPHNSDFPVSQLSNHRLYIYQLKFPGALRMRTSRTLTRTAVPLSLAEDYEDTDVAAEDDTVVADKNATEHAAEDGTEDADQN